MDKFFDIVLRTAVRQACRLRANTMGKTAPGVTFSLTGVGLAIIACILLLDAGFNIRSSTFEADFLRAIRFF